MFLTKSRENYIDSSSQISKEKTKSKKEKGFILACTNKSQNECLKTLTFCTSKIYGSKILSIKKGDFVFLYNLDTDELFGVFEATSDGFYDKNTDLFNGKYPYLVKVKLSDTLKKLENADKFFKTYNISWRNIFTEKGCALIIDALSGKIVEKKNLTKEQIIDEEYRPIIFSTTLWDYPKQSYGDTPKGNNKYPCVTPAFIIYNMIHRYTKPGDTILDPMAGSGTTIDVCKEEQRNCIAFDIKPTRDDIKQCDARSLPLEDETVDMIFIDSPYGDNIKYNEHPDNIGHISALDEKFYDELEKVMKECHRVLKTNKVLGWLIGDQWAKGNIRSSRF
ncbi:MAG: DNA methyltransferase [Brevinematia bacterium]